MKAIIVNDVHSSDKAPRWRRDTYNDEIFEKLYWVGRLARTRAANVVAFPGDLFHNPAPTRNSHLLVHRWLELFDSLPCPVVIVPGNHDLSSGRLETLARQPLGILGKHPNVTLLHHGCREEIGGMVIAGVEWRYDLDSAYITRCIGDRPCDLLLLHAAVAQTPNPFYPTIDPEELVGLAHVVAFGHLHPPEEPYSIGNTMFLNVGALARGSLTESDLHRIPQVGMIELVKGQPATIQLIPVEVAKPAADIFRLEEAQTKRDEHAAVAAFVSDLRSAVLETVTVERLAAAAAGLTDDREVLQLAREILASIE